MKKREIYKGCWIPSKLSSYGNEPKITNSLILRKIIKVQ